MPVLRVRERFFIWKHSERGGVAGKRRAAMWMLCPYALRVQVSLEFLFFTLLANAMGKRGV